MELSVIIVSYNAREFLKNCLRSVIKASEKIDCEVIVVDNNSIDGSCDMVEDEFPDASIIKNKINSGFSAANNQAIKIAKGNFILLLNPDTIVDEDAFTKCITFMNYHPDAGALGVRMVNGSGRFLPESKRALPTVESAFYKITGLSSLFPKSNKLNKYYLSQVKIDETSFTEVISGAFMFLRSEVLKITGLLDEDYFMYGEDIDLSNRILHTRYNNYYFPEVQIVHFKGKCTSRENFDDILHFYKAMRIYVRKNFHFNKNKILSIIVIAAIYSRESIALLIRFFRILRSKIRAFF